MLTLRREMQCIEYVGGSWLCGSLLSCHFSSDVTSNTPLLLATGEARGETVLKMKNKF